jgi:hypothetical protein
MLSQYWLNLLADAAWRAQAITFPATRYLALFTVLPTRSTAGTECAVAGYARQSLAASMANWSGTQGAGTTAASSGSGVNADRISNNVAVEFEDAASVAWSGLVGWGVYDASSGGNLLEFGPIVDASGNAITRSFAIGDAVEFAAGTLQVIFA